MTIYVWIFTYQEDTFFTSQRELLVYHKHKTTVKIIILNNLPFSNFDNSNTLQCWYMIRSSKKPFFLHMIWSNDQPSSYKKVAGLNPALSYVLCPLTRLFIYIVYVHQAAIRYQITLVGGYLGWAGVPSREGGGGVKASHTYMYILVYFL